MKCKIKTSRTLYTPDFTSFQKTYMKMQRWSSMLAALVGLILLSPLFLLLCIWIFADSGGPVFFAQKRVGRSAEDGTYRYFQIYKFRTMYIDTPEDIPTHMLENPEAYITRAGRFLRKTSLDELPQLINVIRGDMNLIGPRPALYNQKDLMAERDRYGANFIRPGITGLAQVMGRDELPIRTKARYDGIYTQHVGPLADLFCLFRTVGVVLTGHGIVEGGTGDMVHKKKKLLIITNHSYMLYQFRRELIGRLLEHYEIVISMPFTGHEEDFSEMGCKCLDTKVDRRGINLVSDIRLLRTYHRIIREEQPDKVLTYSIKPNIYGGMICGCRGIPCYANVQGLGTAFENRLLALFVEALYKLAFRNVEKVFFENRENAQQFEGRGLIKKEKIIVLHGAGVNLDRYAYTPFPSGKGREEEKIHFLYLGRIMKEKGMDELFWAMEKLYDAYKDKVILDIVGFFEDEYKDRVEELARRNIAVFHGFQEDPRPHYVRADCVVLPSYHEGMSNVLLEASAVGRPVITSDIPGCREAVEDNVTGYLCPAKNREILYDKMKQMTDLSRKEREKMGKAARKRMEELFDKNEVVEQTVEVIEGK